MTSAEIIRTKTIIDPPIPIYNVIKQESQESGVYRHYQTKIIIDAPFGVGFDAPVALIGLMGIGSDPIVLKFDQSTQIEIEGKIYTVLLKDIYEPIDEISQS